MLEGLKDENGQIKKPILYSLIGGAGLVGYLLLKGGGSSGTTTSSTGQDASLADAIGTLQQGVQGLGGGSSSGGSSSGGSTTKPPSGGGTHPVGDIPPGTPRPTQTKQTSGGGSSLLQRLSPTPISSRTTSITPNPRATVTPGLLSMDQLTAIKEVAARAGDNGSAGGGGQGLVTVPTIQSVSSTVYAGLTHDQLTTIKEAPPTVVNTVKSIPGGAAAVRRLPLSHDKLTAIKEATPAPVTSVGGISSNPTANTRATTRAIPA